MVILDKQSHIYRDSDNNEYQSVTRFINKFVPEFDFDKKSKQYASKYGLNVEEVRDSWRLKNKLSTDFGTLIHEQIENFLKDKKVTDFESHIKDISEKVREEFPTGKYLHEHVLWNSSYKVAGTSDLIIDEKNFFSIIDFKTNKQIKYTNDFEHKFLHKPVNHLPNSEYFKYALQLSFYAYFYKLHSKKPLNRLCFYWLKRKKDSYDDLTGSQWVRYNVPYLEEEVITLLNYEK